MAGYGWDEYDIRRGGRETIHDAGNSLDLTIDFIKVPGGQHGGSWGARVKGVPREDAPAEQLTTMVFYTTLEGLGSLGLANEAETLGFEGDVKFNGHTPDLGDFSIDVTTGPESNGHPFHSHPTYENKPLDRTLVASVNMPPEHLWQPKGTYSWYSESWGFLGFVELIACIAILFTQMKGEVDNYIQSYGAENPPPPAQVFTIKNNPGDGNIHLVQKVFQGAFEVCRSIAVEMRSLHI